MIEKYNGTLEISQQEHKFTVDVLLYISGNIGLLKSDIVKI